MFVGLTLIWGSTYFWQKMALAEIGPFQLVSLRFTVAFLVLTALMLARKLTFPRDLRKRVFDRASFWTADRMNPDPGNDSHGVTQRPDEGFSLFQIGKDQQKSLSGGFVMACGSMILKPCRITISR